MPYTVDWQEDVLAIEIADSLVESDLMSILQTTRQDERYASIRYVLVDLIGLKSFDVNIAELVHFSLNDSHVAAMSSGAPALLVVARQDFIHSMTKVYQWQTKDFGRTVEMFTERSDAIEWIKKDL